MSIQTLMSIVNSRFKHQAMDLKRRSLKSNGRYRMFTYIEHLKVYKSIKYIPILQYKYNNRAWIIRKVA